MIVIQDGSSWLVFSRPLEIITASHKDKVIPALQRIDRLVASEDLHAAGFLSYEAAAAYGLAVHEPKREDPPLLYFGLFSRPQRYRLLSDIDTDAGGEYRVSDWRPLTGRGAYADGIEKIKSYLACGLTYQINYTFPLQADFSGSPWALWRTLLRRQEAEYSAYIDTGSHVICSLSPELFFRLDGGTLVSKPMKGTAARGLRPADDEERGAALSRCEKNRAENMMIVDMIRNDMGRIAEIGTVEVPALFDVERYPTLFQMTSTVRCRTDVPLSAIFAAMFPCASITGAPKVKSMELIKGLETAPRGVYCGSIGYAGPGRKAAFNVAIRTLTFDRLSKRAVYGVGGGVVWDSAEEMEYEECLLKAHVLEHDMPEFKLLESLLWEPAGGYFLLERHLQRLTESAAYFGFPLREDEVRACLAELGKGLDAPAKVRLLVDKGGTAALEAQALEPPGTAAAVPLRLAVCRTPVDSSDVFLYHKTTVRRLYEDAKASRPDCDDVIIMNERGEVTEASSSNIMVEVSGAFYTPPVECGLLPGTYRAELIAAGMLSERVLYPADLYRAESVALINSVRRKRNAAVLP